MNNFIEKNELIFQLKQSVLNHWSHLNVEIASEIDSTNSELMRRARYSIDPENNVHHNFDDLNHFNNQNRPVTLLMAKHQTSGHGRLNRPWHGKSHSSLMFSLALPFAPQNWAIWSGLSLAVGLWIAEALAPDCADLGLKWPNDLWRQNRKLGGILIETVSLPNSNQAQNQSDSARQLILGIGLNVLPPDVSNDVLSTPAASVSELPFFEQLLNHPTKNETNSAKIDSLIDSRIAFVLLHLLPVLAKGLSDFEREGFAPLQKRYLKRDVLFKQALFLSDDREGLGAGINEQGILLLKTANGIETIHSSEVSVRLKQNPNNR